MCHLPCQNKALHSSYSRRSASHIRWKTPASRHSSKRLYTVLDSPRSRGSDSRLRSVRSLHNIASIVFRLPICECPPSDLGSSGGSNGSICSQSASEIWYDLLPPLSAIVRPPRRTCRWLVQSINQAPETSWQHVLLLSFCP